MGNFDTNPHRITERLARAYKGAVRGAHYSADGSNAYADGIVAAAAAVMETDDYDRVEGELDAIGADLEDEG